MSVFIRPVVDRRTWEFGTHDFTGASIHIPSVWEPNLSHNDLHEAAAGGTNLPFIRLTVDRSTC